MGTHPIFESDFDCLTEWFEDEILSPFDGRTSGRDFWGRRCSSKQNQLCDWRLPKRGLHLRRRMLIYWQGVRRFLAVPSGYQQVECVVIEGDARQTSRCEIRRRT